ncbi:MAG: MBOAT family O-acyltransferase [Acetobacteraceae bacterium]|nr:MBOAT family O-acyltransferase [Acetobacteraceae bacterium]
MLVFLPAVLALFYAAPGLRSRQAVLVVASLAFYGYWDLRFVPALVGLTLAVWLIARLYQATLWRWVPVAGIVLNLGVLGVCKYANFLGASVAGLLGIGFTPFDIILPLGVSFFTFQKISYLVDLRRGDRHFYGLLEFFAFVTFFPQLIAGPIVRHNELMPQWRLDPHGPALWSFLSRGFVLFTIGFAKKAGIADTLAPIVDPLFAQSVAGPLGLAAGWVAAVGYALQIYFDFSGYSDMAIGLGLMFGLRLPLNFDAPYRSCSIREMWRRWHMTLSRFLRDYVYIPLGGNRAGALAQARNVVATMLLGGLWHGAAWTFVFWGGLQGGALAVNGMWSRRGLRMPAALGWALTTLFFVAAFVFFRAESFGSALHVLGGMAGLGGGAPFHLKDWWILPVAALAAVLGPTSQSLVLERLRPVGWMAIPAGAALVGLILLSGGRLPNEFIYFQF